jgi:two-component system, response regulator PdtaR
MKRIIRILVVEDEFLIAMELTAILEAHGFFVIGPVGTVDDALEILRRERPDAVVLELNLCGIAATPVARLLRELDLPFVIASAYSNTDLPRDDSLRGVANIGKPTNSATLIQVLQRITYAES